MPPNITMFIWDYVSWQVVSFCFMKDSNLLVVGNLSKLLLSICSNICSLHGLKSHAVRNVMRPRGLMLSFPMLLQIMTSPISRKPCHRKFSWNYGKARLQHLPNEVEGDLTEMLRWAIFKLFVSTGQSYHCDVEAMWHSILRRVEIIGRIAVDKVHLTKSFL